MSNEQLTKKDVDDLLSINQLLYTITAPTNPVIERTQKKSFAEGGSGTSYTGNDHLIVNLQTGTEFIDPLQSFLVFDLGIESKENASGPEGWEFGFQGSAVNLIRDSQVSTRSGKEMDRLEQCNLLNYHKTKGSSRDFVDYNLSALMLAHSATTKPEGIDLLAKSRKLIRIADGDSSSSAVRIMIPLKYVSPIFDSPKLMPPHLARGLRVDCTMEDVRTALTTWTALDAGQQDGIDYVITKPYILTDSYRMADSVLNYLNDEYAGKKDGLVYEYFSYHTTKTTINSSDLNVEIRRSVSLAMDAFAVTRSQLHKTTLLADSFASLPMSSEDYSQWRIGSHYLPNDKIRGVIEHYAQMLYWKKMLRDDKITGTDAHNFTGYEPPAPTIPTPIAMNYGDGKFCTTLEQSNILDLSGIAINNSMTLALDAYLDAAGSRDVSVFLRHVRRAVCFLESIILTT